ncbi:hypothetical protein ACFOZ7_20390 [Natribaculum luteum]|uniref:Alpha/beta hydrolase n=1 Tax=Natribaculum luteum TaxID=1586232 RepID=A0ABD5P5P6_9EURY|nr:hypothetical protein [Natribaculum luteum]
MKHHELLDVATVRSSALLLRNAKFFARSVDAPPITDVAAGTRVRVDDVSSAGVQEVVVETPVGEFEAAYLPWQWRGTEYPTLLYHHGSGERPFDFGRFSSNSFRRLFVSSDREVPANVVAVRAPFHDRSSVEYARAMGDLENFVGMLAASVGLLEALAERVREQGSPGVVASGISLGGWAVNIHRACVGGLERYAPIFAGAALGEMFVSSVYRKMTGERARANPDRLRNVLDFEGAFAAGDADDCSPLLARYDRIIEFERQRGIYDDHPMAVIEKGHVTGSLATETLRGHVLEAIRRT